MYVESLPFTEATANALAGYHVKDERTQSFDDAVSHHNNVWQTRLAIFRNAERAVQKAKRLMAISMIVIVVSLSILYFSLNVAPVPSDWLFVIECVALVTGLLAVPASFLLLKEQRRHRDALSRRFYESNHEVDVTDSHLSLINRGNYAVVTRVPLLGR